MDNKPFIHTFKTPCGFYFFDVNTNQIVDVDEKTYQYLQNMADVPDLHVEKELTKLKSQGYLSNKRPLRMTPIKDDFLEHCLNEKIAQLTLQVTRNCNFKCSYCLYTAGDSANHRSHSSQKMTLEMAIACVDFFWTRSKSQGKIAIGFYGGEPLLEFDLIKNVVYYAEKMFEGRDLNFVMTTNGSLFNDENIEFLSKHNFNIMVSIDGTPEVHNQSRKFAYNGEGTFHIIEKNLKKIKNVSPEFFKNFSFSVVMDPRNKYDELQKMFSIEDIFEGKNMRSTIMDDYYMTEKVTFSDEYMIERSIHEFKSYLSILGKYTNNKSSGFTKNNIITEYKKNKSTMKKQKTLIDEMSHSGPCVPGQQKLFVTVNGDFIPCEKVNEMSDVMCIGNIYDGFDYEKIRKLLDIVKLTEKNCINCWAIQHCTQCARNCDNNGELSAKLKESYCKDIKYNVEKFFKEYVMFKELGNKIRGNNNGKLQNSGISL